jgi:hypothetical protein
MLLIISAVATLVAVVMVPRIRMPGGVEDAHLGWMSERWLTEHRAAHSG